MNYKEYLGFSEEGCDLSILKDVRGALRTQSLFLEMATADKRVKYPPLYTLRDDTYEGLPSAYKVYMASVDEYSAAIKLVGSMKHWRKLCNLSWFMDGKLNSTFDGLAQWREDMKLRDASWAKRVLIESGDPSSARAILTLSSDKPKAPVGRPPTKDDKASAEADKLEQERQARIAEAAKKRG